MTLMINFDGKFRRFVTNEEAASWRREFGVDPVDQALRNLKHRFRRQGAFKRVEVDDELEEAVEGSTRDGKGRGRGGGRGGEGGGGGVRRKKKKSYVYKAEMPDELQASLMLHHDVIRKLKVKGNHVIAIPVPGSLFVTGTACNER